MMTFIIDLADFYSLDFVSEVIFSSLIILPVSMF